MSLRSRFSGRRQSTDHSTASGRGRTFRRDLVAGIPGAISSVPNGMAAAVLVGVNPVHGLYASFAGPVAGGLLASTQRMVITTTTAAALATGSALEQVEPADRPGALVLITLLAGAAMIVAGMYRLGRYTRFVSHSVMTGFLTGVSVNILLGQLPQLAGATAEGSTALGKAIHLLLHPGSIDPVSLLTGLVAIALLAGLRFTPLTMWATLIAVAVPTVVATLRGAGVPLVSDVGSFPRGLPKPQLPDLGTLSPGLITGALAVAAIALVQGAGVSDTAANRDGQPSDLNRDFLAQGAGNVASSVFGGQPVGGSLGQTALNVASGARSRWAAVCSGCWMLLILGALSGVVGRVAMPTLSAVLMVAAAGSLQFRQLLAIVRTGPISRVAFGTTFIATLFLSVPEAVGLGVALSLVLQLNQEATDLRLVQLVPVGDGTLRECPAPATLADRQVTVLDVYGSLFYAGPRTLEVLLPDPAGSTRAAVVLRLRGHATLGATFITVLARYAERLATTGGKLYLSEVDPGLVDLLHGQAQRAGPVDVFSATDILGESTLAAVRDAQTWLTSDQRPR